MALTFQHVHRVVDSLENSTGGGWKGHAQAVLYWVTNVADVQQAKKASQTYEKVGSISLVDMFIINTLLQEVIPPTLFLVVKALPKDALIEKQVILHTGRCMISEDGDDEPTMQFKVPITEQGIICCRQPRSRH
jgi:diphthine-ammonia ligase